MIKYFITIIFVFALLQNYAQSQEDPYYYDKGWELVNTESMFILNNATKDTDVINLLGEPEKKSEIEYEAATGDTFQVWYYFAQGLNLVLVNSETNEQIVSSITITYPSKLKTSRGIGIGSTKDEVLKAYKKEIDPKNKWGGSESIVAGTEFGGLIFTLKNGKVFCIFIGAAAE